MKVTLRALVPGEFDLVSDVRVAPHQRRWLSTPDLGPFLAEAHLHPEFQQFAILAGGDVVGLVSVGDVGDEKRWISLLVIDERFQRRGFGRAAMEDVLRMAVESGKAAVGLSVHPENAPALALYHSLGFEFNAEPGESGELAGWRQCGGENGVDSAR